jgi:hypothetical protein
MTTILDTTNNALVATVVQGEIVFPVMMEDPIIHDEQHPYCSDSTCPCQQEREVLRARLPLNGNRGFSLLR